jgi:glycosyltransferase involved in cell wall biosynthesis
VTTELPDSPPAERTLPPATVLQLSTMVPPARFGGAERVIAWTTEELERAGMRVHNAGLRNRRAATGDDGAHPIPNVFWPFEGPRRGVVRRTAWHAIDSCTLAARRVVERLVDQVRPSVVVTHNLRGWGLAPWVVAGERDLPLVHVVHDYGLICHTSALWRGEACESLCRPCTVRRRATHRRWPGGSVVGVSRAVLDEHARLGADFVRGGLVIHPGAAATPVTAPHPRRVRREGTPCTLGYLGRIDDAKGLHVLLAALRGCSQRLLVAGSGEEAYVRSLRAGCGENVRWLGWAEPTALFQQVDVLVVPSLWKEPFGLVVVEAARSGVPVLIADRPGLVEAARWAGARYLTFPAGDIDALRVALVRSTADYRVQPAPERSAHLVDVVRRAAEGRAPAGGRPPAEP